MPTAAPTSPAPDLMSELLLDMHLRAVRYRRIEITAPFGLSFGTEAGRAHFHFVAAGTVLLRMPEGDLHPLAPGTAVLLPRGGEHELLSAADRPARSVDSFAAEPVCENLCDISACAGAPGCPDNTIIFSSCMELELGAMQALVRLMPRLMLVDTLADRHPEIPAILKAMESEACGRRVGFAGILGRLADVVSATIVRGWVECGCGDASGLADALRDPRLARAILALHRDPGRDWTVAALAAEAGCSRSVFAQRFQDFIGIAPLRYAAELRMRLATRWIGENRMPIETVANALGYASQAAFSRAFKRVTGCPPGAVRVPAGDRKASGGRPADPSRTDSPPPA
ncbi:AraC family transcriptional regulator [Rhizosaccharibacter radicis]|uniref:AraC family transcriptional regulator n=1 Tax=Rhizosaccharibacter radicis TaxID=2782605 RepID=A0ABT1W1P4_9PROT|nr:AraC family transcriptional regulator [Acetobacteraceae bacterium KSS12]